MLRLKPISEGAASQNGVVSVQDFLSAGVSYSDFCDYFNSIMAIFGNFGSHPTKHIINFIKNKPQAFKIIQSVWKSVMGSRVEVWRGLKSEREYIENHEKVKSTFYAQLGSKKKVTATEFPIQHWTTSKKEAFQFACIAMLPPHRYNGMERGGVGVVWEAVIPTNMVVWASPFVDKQNIYKWLQKTREDMKDKENKYDWNSSPAKGSYYFVQYVGTGFEPEYDGQHDLDGKSEESEIVIYHSAPIEITTIAGSEHGAS